MKNFKKKPTNSATNIPHLERARSQKSFSQLQNNPDLASNADSKKLVKDGFRFLKGNKQNVDEALNKFNEAIEKDTNNSMAFQGRGKCLFFRKQFDKALPDFLMALRLEQKTDNRKQQSEHASLAAQTFVELGMFIEAIEYFSQAIKYNKESGILYYYRAKAKQELGKFEDAVDDYQKAIDKNISVPSQYQLELNSRDLQCQAYFNKGVCLHKLNNIEDAIEELKKVVEFQPDRSEAHNQLGLSFLSNGNREEALLSFNRAIQQDPEPEFYCNRGMAYFQIERNEDALNDFKLAIEKNQNISLFFFYRGDVHLRLKNYQEAHEDYDRALELDNTQPKYYHSKGLAFEFKSNELSNGSEQTILRQNAIKMQKLALEKAGNKYESSEYHLGLMYHSLNEFHQALKHLTNVVDQTQNHSDVYVARGKVHQDMGNHQFALQDFNRALELKKNDSTALYYRGISKMMIKLYDDALLDFREANLNTGNEDNAGILDGQGSCYHALERYDDAIIYFNYALAIDTKNVKFLMNRSKSYLTLGQYEEAIDDLHTALEVDPENSQILYMLGLTYYRLPNYKRAIRTLKKAIKFKPFISYEADIYYHCALAYCRLKKYERSLYPFSVCIQKIPNDIRYVHERAKAYQMIEFHKEALEDFNTVVKMNPRNAHAYFRRGFSNKALGNYKQAADDFEKAKQLDPFNSSLVINYKKMKGINCIVLCDPGEEKEFDK